MVNLVPRKEDCFANPNVFDPDNFMESEKLNKFGFTGFGQGPRNCIGKDFSSSLSIRIELFLGMRYALQTLKLALIQTVRNFNLVKCEETNPEDDLSFSIASSGFKNGSKFKVEKI